MSRAYEGERDRTRSRRPLTVTFRGLLPSDELLFYARRLGASLERDGGAVQSVELTALHDGADSIRVALHGSSPVGAVCVECSGDAFLAVRDAFAAFATRASRSR